MTSLIRVSDVETLFITIHAFLILNLSWLETVTLFSKPNTEIHIAPFASSFIFIDIEMQYQLTLCSEFEIIQ